jgi:hypothetical protein
LGFGVGRAWTAVILTIMLMGLVFFGLASVFFPYFWQYTLCWYLGLAVILIETEQANEK